MHTQGRSIVLFSPRGGAGTTTIAIAIATWLAALAPGRSNVALLDFDVPFGNAAGSMGLTPAATLGHADPQLSESSLRSLFIPSSSGVNVLACPLDPMVAEGIGAAECTAALRCATGLHDVSVVDIGSSLSEAGMGAIETADAILIVTTGDPHGLHSTAACLHTLTLLGVPTNRVLMVLNRMGAPHQLDAEAISRALGDPPVRSVPQTDDLAIATRRGRLLCRDWPDHPWSMAVGHIAELCLAATGAHAAPAFAGTSAPAFAGTGAGVGTGAGAGVGTGTGAGIGAGVGSQFPSPPTPLLEPSGRRWAWRRKRNAKPIGPPSALIGGSTIG